MFTNALGHNRAAEIFDVNAKRKIVNTCGSGMTAAIIWLALQQVGLSSSVYDEVRAITSLPSKDYILIDLELVVDGLRGAARKRDRKRHLADKRIFELIVEIFNTIKIPLDT